MAERWAAGAFRGVARDASAHRTAGRPSGRTAARAPGRSAGRGAVGAPPRHGRPVRGTGCAPPAGDGTAAALGALALAGVVLGHWLVTVFTARDGDLTALPVPSPVVCAVQPLAVLLLVGGRAAVRRHDGAGAARGVPGTGRGARAVLPARALRAAAVLPALWGGAAAVLLATGTGAGTVRALTVSALSPLWYCLVGVVLLAATGPLARVGPVWPLALALHLDLARAVLGGPAALDLAAATVVWAVPYCLGCAWGRGALSRVRTAWVLLVGGVLATTGLVLLGVGAPALPVPAVGGPAPLPRAPAVTAVCVGAAQCGAALLLSGPLRRVVRRPVARAAVAWLRPRAVTVLLWYPTALVVVTTAVLPYGPVPGLHTAPDGAGWVAARLGWLLPCALVLWVCLVAFGGPVPRRGGGTTAAGSPARAADVRPPPVPGPGVPAGSPTGPAPPAVPPVEGEPLDRPPNREAPLVNTPPRVTSMVSTGERARAALRAEGGLPRLSGEPLPAMSRPPFLRRLPHVLAGVRRWSC